MRFQLLNSVSCLEQDPVYPTICSTSPLGYLNVTSKETALVPFPLQTGSQPHPHPTGPPLGGVITSLPRPGSSTTSMANQPHISILFSPPNIFFKFALFCDSLALSPQRMLCHPSPARASYVTRCTLLQCALPQSGHHTPAGVMAVTCKPDEFTFCLNPLKASWFS